MPQNPTKPNHIYLTYMSKKDLTLDNLQWLIYAIKLNKTKSYIFNIYIYK